MNATAFVEARPDEPASIALIAELDRHLAGGNPPGRPIFGLRAGEADDPALRFFRLELDGDPVGCGALRLLEPGIAELKRMFVRPAYRGAGFGRALLEHLERVAGESGIHTLRLETGEWLTDAVSLYRAAGYREIARYGMYVDSADSLCMEKRL